MSCQRADGVADAGDAALGDLRGGVDGGEGLLRVALRLGGLAADLCGFFAEFADGLRGIGGGLLIEERADFDPDDDGEVPWFISALVR